MIIKLGMNVPESPSLMRVCEFVSTGAVPSFASELSPACGKKSGVLQVSWLPVLDRFLQSLA